MRNQFYQTYLVVTLNNIIVLRTDSRSQNIAKLHAWASLHAIEKVKHGVDNLQEVTIQMRKLDPDPAKQPLVFSLRMKNQSELCVARIVKLLKDDGMTMK